MGTNPQNYESLSWNLRVIYNLDEDSNLILDLSSISKDSHKENQDLDPKSLDYQGDEVENPQLIGSSQGSTPIGSWGWEKMDHVAWDLK